MCNREIIAAVRRNMREFEKTPGVKFHSSESAVAARIARDWREIADALDA